MWFTLHNFLVFFNASVNLFTFLHLPNHIKELLYHYMIATFKWLTFGITTFVFPQLSVHSVAFHFLSFLTCTPVSFSMRISFRFPISSSSVQWRSRRCRAGFACSCSGIAIGLMLLKGLPVISFQLLVVRLSIWVLEMSTKYPQREGPWGKSAASTMLRA
jgi:hypothetical protein